MGEPEIKILLARPGRIWDDNIKIDKKKKWVGKVRTGLIWLRKRINGGLL